ncbi:MAG: MotA/TolQ/ExbB proton channel family protein, partial [Planctomycetes bacterium]|nr:MotA/TolQ/ExbB proton channel family protein [Planctomycetota bacterium]
MNRLTRTNTRLAFLIFAWIALLAFFNHQTGPLGAQPPEESAEKTAENASAEEENGDDENAEDENAEDEEPASLGALIFKRPETTSEWVGLAFYILLCVFSMVALTVTLERILHLRHEKVIPKTFVGQVQEQTDKAPATADQLQAIADGSDTAVARILHAGVLRAGRSLAEVEKSMEDAAIREMAAMRARNRPLSVVGSVAPLVGLLGTVVGMIFAFQVS